MKPDKPGRAPGVDLKSIQHTPLDQLSRDEVRTIADRVRQSRTTEVKVARFNSSI